MDLNDFKAQLAEAGVPAETIDAIVKNEKAAAKVAGLRQSREYDDLAARSAAMEAAMNKSKQYETWYSTNYAAIVKLQQDAARYQERYGSLDDPNAGQPAAKAEPKFSAEDVQKIVNETIASNYGPRWSELLEGFGDVIQSHVLKGRKNKVDIKAVAKLAQEKHSGNMSAAYEEWDRPESEKVAKEDTEKEIDRRVKEKLAAARTSSGFPAGADASPSYAPSGLSKDKGDQKYDRSKLLETAASGVYERPN